MDFGICGGSLNQCPADTEGQLSFGGIKIYMRIFDCMRVGDPTPALFKGQLYSAT